MAANTRESQVRMSTLLDVRRQIKCPLEESASYTLQMKCPLEDSASYTLQIKCPLVENASYTI